MVNLDLTAESLERLSPQIERLLGAIERLHQVDVAAIEPDFLTPCKEQ
jgi:Asp-tRNA(Asn)/Glu-tRNA(Gln) amidotransferase C subunit